MVIKRNNNLPHVEIICFLYSDKKWRGQATPSRKMPGIPLLLEKTKIPSGKLSANIYLLVKDRENIYCCPRFNLYTYDNIHIFINKIISTLRIRSYTFRDGGIYIYQNTIIIIHFGQINIQ